MTTVKGGPGARGVMQTPAVDAAKAPQTAPPVAPTRDARESPGFAGTVTTDGETAAALARLSAGQAPAGRSPAATREAMPASRFCAVASISRARASLRPAPTQSQ